MFGSVKNLTGGARTIGAVALVVVSCVGLSACTSSDADRGGASGSNAATATSGATSSGAPSTATTTGGAPSSSVRSSESASATRGTINDTVPTRAVTTREPVALTATARISSDVTARLSSIRSISAKAKGPGEISGPALELTIRLINKSSGSLNLGNAVVNLTGSNGSPGLPIAGSPARPFAGTLAAGRTTDAVYVFTVAAKLRSRITVSVSYAATAPVVVFVGRAA